MVTDPTERQTTSRLIKTKNENEDVERKSRKKTTMIGWQSHWASRNIIKSNQRANTHQVKKKKNYVKFSVSQLHHLKRNNSFTFRSFRLDSNESSFLLCVFLQMIYQQNCKRINRRMDKTVLWSHSTELFLFVFLFSESKFQPPISLATMLYQSEFITKSKVKQKQFFVVSESFVSTFLRNRNAISATPMWHFESMQCQKLNRYASVWH